MWDKLDCSKIPVVNDFDNYIRNPLWQKFYSYMDEEYNIKPKFEYSGCSMLPGWNAKFKKSGKNLCTVYPDENFFIVLIVIGKNEKEQVEGELASFTEYIQDLYRSTSEGMGQRWLKIIFEDEHIFKDIKRLIAIRKG